MIPFNYLATYHNYYNYYSTQAKNDERNFEYITIITNMLAEMFIIKGLSHEDTTRLMRTILLNGSCYFKKENDKCAIVAGNYVGYQSAYNDVPEEYHAHTYEFDFEGIPDSSNNETICYLFPQRLPLTQIFRFASQFAEIDTSLVNNIQFARIAPIAVVTNERVQELYEKAITKMLSGELINSILSALNSVSDKPLSLATLDISDGKYSEKIQYLSMYHEQMISRLCKMFGISYTYISKQANITNDELHNSDDFCAIYPLMMKSNINECLEKIGLHAEFNKPWEWIDRLEEMHDISDMKIDNEGDNDVHSKENTQDS